MRDSGVSFRAQMTIDAVDAGRDVYVASAPRVEG
jgi:hypothetical protein